MEKTVNTIFMGSEDSKPSLKMGSTIIARCYYKRNGASYLRSRFGDKFKMNNLDIPSGKDYTITMYIIEV